MKTTSLNIRSVSITPKSPQDIQQANDNTETEDNQGSNYSDSDHDENQNSENSDDDDDDNGADESNNTATNPTAIVHKTYGLRTMMQQ